MNLLLPLPLALALPLALPQSPQFRELKNVLPASAQWSTGVRCADVDRDGDLDLLFAESEGHDLPGAELQNVLLVNQLLETGTFAFTDESVARLGVQASHAQAVLAGDVDGDGWVDLLYLNAFHTDPPSLFINQGAAAPGFFTLESVLRGFTTPLNSRNGQLGDVDDDGDLDLVVADAGPSAFGAPGGKPRLYLNDGVGYFAEAPLAAPDKVAHADVLLVDVDGDWDLDICGVNRGTNAGGDHYLLLNQGDATFQDVSALFPGQSGLSHAAEAADFDLDGDLDFMMLSAAGQAEAVIRNDLVGGGALGFTQLGAIPGSAFDRALALLDLDDDGDLDVLLGSDEASELVLVNEGGLAFTADPARFHALADPTADIAVADLNGDGRADVVTAQGGPGGGDFQNKVYKNTGAFDTLAPRIVRTEAPQSLPPAGPWAIHAEVRDAVVDDGADGVTGVAYSRVESSPLQAFVTIQDGAFVPSVLQIESGTSVFWTSASTKFQSVACSDPVFPFDSGPIGPQGGFERRFITPGVYPITSLSGLTAEVVVSGGATQTTSLVQGDGIHRFELPDTLGGAGTLLAFDLIFFDYAGNTVALPNSVVELLDCSASSYCLGKVNSLGCQPTIGAAGHSSVSLSRGFVIRSQQNLNEKPGVLLYGTTGAQQVQFQGGYLCVKSPVRRSSPVFSGGSAAPAKDCSGVFALDFNAFAAGLLGGNPAPELGMPGTLVYAQYWGRDNQATAGTSLSSALQFSRCP